MPYNKSTIYLTFGGLLPSGEEWQCGIHCDVGTLNVNQTELQDWVDEAVDAVKAYWSSAGVAALNSGSSDLSRVTAYLILANSTKSSLVAYGAFDAVAGSGAITMPDQVAVVVSLRTLDPGRRGRARFYLPASGAPISGVGQLESSVPATLAGNTSDLLVSLGNIASTRPLGGTSGFPVDRVVVDSVFDTQRRRRNAIKPTTVASDSVPIP